MIRSTLPAVFSVFLTLAFAFAQEAPVVLWCSSPVQPGETVLIHGGRFGSAPVVELTLGDSADGERKRTVQPLSVSDTAILFVLPEQWPPGLVYGKVRTALPDGAAGTPGSLESEPFLVNQPNVFWVQGDRGRKASAMSGTIWLFGNCLVFGESDRPHVVLRDAAGNTFTPKIDSATPFAITASWDDADGPAVGQYEVWLQRNDREKPIVSGSIHIAPTAALYPAEVFNVVDFGAVANDGIDDTGAILDAVEALTANGGGTLLFPRGRFQMTAMIELPPHSAVRGMGAHLSQVYWPDTFEPHEALIKGTHSFEVSDIFLACGFHQDGIVGNPAVPRSPMPDEEAADYQTGNIAIRNVTLRMVYSQYVNDHKDELKRRLSLLHHTRALRFGGENITIIGNDIYCAAGGVFELRAYWSRVAGNRFCRGNVIGWNGFSGQQLIVDNNHLGGANCTSFYGLPEGSENIYWANNFHENNFDGNNRETITGDGRVHGYMDTVEDIAPNAFTLKNAVPLQRGEWTWRNGAVQIVSGQGAGQFRRIELIEGRRITVTEPWNIVPNENSVLSISSFRRRFIYVNNRAYDSSVALQFYGSMMEGIFADNETARTGGYNADAMAGETNWFNQFLRNRITVGNQYRGPRNEVPPTDAQLGLLAYGTGTGKHKYPPVRSCVVRNNRLEGNARLNIMGWVEDALLEGNIVSHADVGATVSDTARNIVLRNNTFRDVLRPYVFSRQSVVLRPGEELAAGLQAVRGHLTADESSEWQPTARVESLPDMPSGQAAELRRTALRELATVLNGRTLPLEALEQLLGLKIFVANWQTAAPILRGGEAGARPLLMRAAECKLPARLKLSVQPKDLPGPDWRFDIPDFNLEPGTITDQNSMLTKPSGAAWFLRIPLIGELSGDGWKLSVRVTVFDPWDHIVLSSFQVSRPLANPLGRQGRLGYLPYDQAPRPADDELIDAPIEGGRFAFAGFYEGAGVEKEQLDGAVIYARSAFHAAAPVKVKFLFGGNCLLYVNGRIVGTTLGRGQWGFANLQEGRNLIEMIMLPTTRSEYRVGLPRIVWADGAIQGT